MVHRLSTELRPGVLDDLGLVAAMEWLGSDFTQKHQIPCQVDFTASETRIGDKSATILFRIVQEALINISRHARASGAFVETWEDGHLLNIRIRDDGVGITDGQLTSPQAFGLIGIRERVLGMKGTFTVTGLEGKGTTLLVTIPLPPEGRLP